MGTEIISGVNFYPLSPIETTGGKVMHAIKKLDEHFPTFGECYFSTADNNNPKAWKKHSKMICNLFVPYGTIRFVFFDDRPESTTYNEIRELEIGENNYGRLVIHPGIWFGFASVGAEGGQSIVLNAASIPHDPSESLRLEPNDHQIPYTWLF